LRKGKLFARLTDVMNEEASGERGKLGRSGENCPNLPKFSLEDA